MSRALAAGNWKMNGSRAFIDDYVSGLAVGIGAGNSADEGQMAPLVLIPPVGYLRLLADAVERAGLAGVSVGAQNLHAEEAGAFTGEMSAEMLMDLGAEWVLVGHSERREQAGETDAIISRKVAAALRAGLKPMLCVGETEAERESGRAAEVVVAQVTAVMDYCGIEAFDSGAVAYEPVWAIGTGKTATPALAGEMHEIIRRALALRSAEVAARIPLLYGGSVKGANAGELFAEADIDGGLVGGASLDAAEMLEIVRALSARTPAGGKAG